jgi:hypothetical protein
MSVSRSNIFSETFRQMNKTMRVSKPNLMANYSEELVSKCWEVMSGLIRRNYESGRGTIVKKFGNFTFKNIEFNFEGTTNQFDRDLKPRSPVFIVSSEFLDILKPGLYTDDNGVIYYNQGKNNNLGHSQLNLAELSFSIGVKREEAFKVLDSMFMFIRDAILRGEFISKEMPGIGALCIRNSLMAVKFEKELIDRTRFVPQKLINTKKHVNLFMKSTDNFYGKRLNSIKELPNVNEALKNIRPTQYILFNIVRFT